MNNLKDEYLAAIDRVPKGRKITAAAVCRVLSKDPSSLKRERCKKYPYLQEVFEAISKAEEKRQNNLKNINSIDNEIRKKNKYKEEKEEFKSLLEKAYAREATLLMRINELERALEAYSTENLRLLRPRK